ncbi:retrotransposon protein, putative, ty1-copia subclass [Tanacetum coccineum]
MFQAKASNERLDVVKSLIACEPKPRASICAFVLEMKGYFDRLESLNMVFDAELSINIIISGLPADYNQFVLSYQMNEKETSIMELHSLLQTTEQGIKKIDVPSTSAAPVMTVGHNSKKRKTSHSNWKRKAAKGKSDCGSKRKVESKIAPTSDPKEAGLKESRMLKHGELNLFMRNRKITLVTRIGKYELMLKSRDGYKVSFDDENRDILVYLNGCFMFIASLYKAQRGVLFEREMISKEDSGSKIDLKEIQESADEEPIVNTDTQQEVVTPVKPDDISLPIRRTSGKVSKPPQFYYGFHIEKDKICDSTLSELDEPANYKEAMASPRVAKWKEAMKMGCKWIFMKKTNIDGKVHTYKARLVAKGYTQTHVIDYEETFSPVAKIKSIWIMLAIVAFHNYEIWQRDVKTAFLNEKLTEDVFMAQPKGFENAKYPKRVYKLQKVIYGLKQASRSWNLCFHEKVTQFGFSRSEDESCIYVKVSGSIVVFLVLYVDDILLIGNDIPMLQSVKDWLERFKRCSIYSWYKNLHR